MGIDKCSGSAVKHPDLIIRAFIKMHLFSGQMFDAGRRIEIGPVSQQFDILIHQLMPVVADRGYGLFDIGDGACHQDIYNQHQRENHQQDLANRSPQLHPARQIEKILV